MMNKRLHSWLPGLVMLQAIALLGTILFSWVGGLYGLPLQNLLANEGVRWMLRNLIPNFGNMPVLSLLLYLMGWGIARSSGWLHVVRNFLRSGVRQLSPRQRWGFQVSVLTLCAYVLLLSFGFWGSDPVFLSVTGEVLHGPLHAGMAVLVLLGCLLVFGVYAWVSGRYRKPADFVNAMANGVGEWSILFIILFLLGQQLAFLQYVLG
ncbi:MAG: AbgT family transporter [Bacteroidaceae bacterium]|nr:AbgT family transporter [Bacteroidaceae bacterium]